MYRLLALTRTTDPNISHFNFLFVPWCGGLSWLPVSFLLHVKYTLSYRIVSYRTLQCGMWLWNHDSKFTKWQHPAMWYVALGWHAMEFAQTFAMLEFYSWFRFWQSPQATDMSFCTSLRNFIQIGPPSAEKNDAMSIFKMVDLSHLGF